MLDRPRAITLAWAATTLALFVVLTIAVTQEWGALVDFDHRGQPARDWAVDQNWLHDPLRWFEIAFGTIAMTAYTVVLAVAMWVKGHRRAAGFTVGVMALTALATSITKLAISRDRPTWQNAEDLLTNKAFPSGHASSIAALSGVVIVLIVMLVRRRSIRVLVYPLVIAIAVIVGADRIFLGRHYPTDVLGGALLGAFFVLIGLALFTPLPRSHAAKIEPLTDAVPKSDRRLAVILNPIKVESVEAFQQMVTGLASETGWSEPTWHFTTVEDPGTGQAEQASVDGADLVIVCGGDGTVREVCAELAGTGIPVGIVPAGTGNLLARNLVVPLYIRAAIDVALTGQDRAIDMVAVSGDGIENTHFMVMAGMGFDAALMEGVNEQIKKKVGWLAYVWSGLKALMFPAMKVEISMDGGEYQTVRARTIVVGNVGYLQAGMPLLPDATIDDGLIDVVALYPRRFLSWIPLAIRVLAKRSSTDETIMRMTGRSVHIRASADIPRQLDGDSIGLGRELTMECIHGRLLVRVPR